MGGTIITAVIGGIDDWVKVKSRRNVGGLSRGAKSALQIPVIVAFCVAHVASGSCTAIAVTRCSTGKRRQLRRRTRGPARRVPVVGNPMSIFRRGPRARPLLPRRAGRERVTFGTVLAVIEFALVMSVIATFIILLVGGLEAIDVIKKRRELHVDPQQVLAVRFARGEIDEAEYSRRLSILRLGPPLEIPD